MKIGKENRENSQNQLKNIKISAPRATQGLRGNEGTIVISRELRVQVALFSSEGGRRGKLEEKSEKN